MVSIKYIICIAIGIFIGWWFTRVYSDRLADREAQLLYYKSEEYSKEKVRERMDSIRDVYENRKIEADINMEREFVELVNKRSEYTTEGMGKRIMEILNSRKSNPD